MPRLSVVVPFYNVADYIADCLDSLRRQTYDDLEVVLVDDGSTDGSRAVAEQFAARDPRFRIVTQHNQGLGPARNTGARHCDAEYVTFVDSDDLVPRYAYDLMVRSLDETGSSFAAGGARRFSNSLGVRPSFLHRVPFAADRLTTHALEFPALALDRMVWNKVYRRSFWDEFGYQFPAIRYEDYPVTLPAHLDAVTVDCLAGPVYYWRERESGESITQQKWEYGNLLDRVVSAEMVLDIVDGRAPTLRRRVHGHFAQVDLTALVQAFASIPDGRRDDLIELGKRMTSRLDPRVLAKASRYHRLQFRALHAGEFDLLQRLARFQLDGGVGGVRARRHPLTTRYEAQYPGLCDRHRSMPRRLYRLTRKSLALVTSVRRVEWTERDLVVRATAEIRHLPAVPRSALRVSIIQGARRTPVEITRFEAPDTLGGTGLVGFEARVPRATLAALPRTGNHVYFSVDLTTMGVRRTGELRGAIEGNPQTAPGDWVGDGAWIQPGINRVGWFVLRPYYDPWQITDAGIVDGALRVRVRLPGEQAGSELTLRRSAGAETAAKLEPPDDGGDGYTALIPLSDLTDGVNPDDPFTMSTVWTMWVNGGAEPRQPLAVGLPRTVAHTHHGRLVRLTRSPGNVAQILEGPARLVSDDLRVEATDGGPNLVVSGDLHAGTVHPVAWRRYLAGDVHVDLACDVAAGGGRWSATIDLARLIDTCDSPPSRGPRAVWSLYAVPDDGSAYAVHLDSYLSTRLPVEIAAGGASVTVAPSASTFHLGVG